MSPPVTIRDVARVAAVSVSTASLALNHPSRVSEDRRRRVLDAADALGFIPKADAVARARRGVGRIGVLGPFSSYTTAGRRLNGVLRAAADSAFEVVVFDQESAATSPAPLLAALPRTGRLDALLIVSQPLDEGIVRRLQDLQLPAVLVDVRHPGLSSVHTDDAAGGRLVADHLLRLGHRRVAFLGEAQRSDRYASPAQSRLAGFRSALAEAGHPLAEGAVHWTPRDVVSARTAAASLLSAADAPTAVFASDDFLAAAVSTAVRHSGPDPAGSVAVVGFDATDLAEFLDLTTVWQPLEESGEAAFQMAAQQLRAPGPARETTLALRLIPRGSTVDRPPAHRPARASRRRPPRDAAIG